MDEEKRVLAPSEVRQIKLDTEEGKVDWTVLEVTLDMDMIKELIRGENVEVHNKDMGTASVVITIDDQEELLED